MNNAFLNSGAQGFNPLYNLASTPANTTYVINTNAASVNVPNATYVNSSAVPTPAQPAQPTPEHTRSASNTSASVPMSMTMSMTRANKQLIRLRDLVTEKSPSYNTVYGLETSLLTFDEATATKQLAEIRSSVEEYHTIRILTERWRNRLFEFNVKYGLHYILSEIDLLKKERTELKKIITDYEKSSYITLDSAQISMKAVKDAEKKFEFKWKIGAFDVDKLKERILAINKAVAILDDKKDDINIKNTFSIVLNDAELKLLDVEK